jgi:hypothetical protein
MKNVYFNGISGIFSYKSYMNAIIYVAATVAAVVAAFSVAAAGLFAVPKPKGGGGLGSGSAELLFTKSFQTI